MISHDIGHIVSEADNAKALFVFAHGAGAGMEHDFMDKMAALLVKENISVLRFNFSYMDVRAKEGNRRPPDRMPKLLERYRVVIEQLKQNGLPLYIGGKSMGSRVAATLLQESPELAKGVICLGYPFHPQKKPEKLRLEPLQGITKTCLIVQGERDALGNQQEIAEYDLDEKVSVHYLADGDHDLKPRVRSGHSHQQHLAAAAKAINEFVEANSNVD